MKIFFYGAQGELKQTIGVVSGGGGVTAHSALTGLPAPADDHTQYLLRQPTANWTIDATLSYVGAIGGAVDTNYFLKIYGHSLVANQTIGKVAFTVIGANGQTEDLVHIKNYAGSELVTVTKDGAVGIRTTPMTNSWLDVLTSSNPIDLYSGIVALRSVAVAAYPELRFYSWAGSLALAYPFHIKLQGGANHALIFSTQSGSSNRGSESVTAVLSLLKTFDVQVDNGNLLVKSGYIEVPEIAKPSTPASGFGRIYAKSDNKLYFINDAGTESDLTAAGGGGSTAPVWADMWGLSLGLSGDFWRARISGGNTAFFNFTVPDDFSSLTSLEMVAFATTTGTYDLDYTSDYGNPDAGETKTHHSESSLTNTGAITVNVLTWFDVSAVVSVLAAGDVVGIQITDGGAGPIIEALGLRMIYT
jgi:hypothetical protein